MINQGMYYELALQNARNNRQSPGVRALWADDYQFMTKRERELERQAFWTALIMFIAIGSPFLITRLTG